MSENEYVDVSIKPKADIKQIFILIQAVLIIILVCSLFYFITIQREGIKCLNNPLGYVMSKEPSLSCECSLRGQSFIINDSGISAKTYHSFDMNSENLSFNLTAFT